MRESLNENPIVQAVVIGVLLLAGAVLLLTQMGGGGGSGGSDTGSASATVTSPEGATASVTATNDGDQTSVTQSVSVPNEVLQAAVAAPTALPTGKFAPGPGVPRSLVEDHDSGKTVVLLVYDKHGLEDAPVRAAVDNLRGDPKVAVYETPAQGVARYAGITQGVGVNQVPALVVVSPHESGGTPRATVTYGFRGQGSVEQKVRDAVYRGPARGYDPG